MTMDIKSKVRAGVATAALAAVVVGGVAVASNATEDDRPVLEQTTVGAPDEGVVEATTTTVPSTTVDVTPVETTAAPVETTVAPVETTAPTTSQEPATPPTTAPAAPTTTTVLLPSAPNVVGMTQNDATSTLLLAGVAVHTATHACETPADAVVWQEPAAGQPIGPDGVVVIGICR